VDDPRNRQNIEAARSIAPFDPVEGHGLLQALRHVLANDRAHDTTQIQVEARMWLKQDRKGFLAKFADLEKAEYANPPSNRNGKAVEDEVDEGSDRCIALMERLIGEYHEEEARENAALAARPDAARIGATLQNRLKTSLDRQSRLEQQVADLRRQLSALGG
jgi:hypothetical protein